MWAVRELRIARRSASCSEVEHKWEAVCRQYILRSAPGCLYLPAVDFVYLQLISDPVWKPSLRFQGNLSTRERFWRDPSIYSVLVEPPLVVFWNEQLMLKRAQVLHNESIQCAVVLYLRCLLAMSTMYKVLYGWIMCWGARVRR